MSHATNLLQQTNWEIRNEIAEALGFVGAGENIRFCSNLRMIAPLTNGWDVQDAVLAYIDHLQK